MTQGYSPPGGHVNPSTTQVATEQAAGVGQKATERGGQVAGVAADQAKQVAAEARRQAGELMDQGLGEVRQQARAGQAKAVEQLHVIADHLQAMADKTDEPGVAPDVVHEVAQRTKKVASWLENREPGDVVGEVRAFARKRPGAFLLGAAAAGLLVGRLTRGAVAAQKDDARTAGQGLARPTEESSPVPVSSWQTTDQFPAQPYPAHLSDGSPLPRTGVAPAHAAPGYAAPGVQEPGMGRQPGAGL